MPVNFLEIIKRWLPVLLVMAVIFLLSSMSSKEVATAISPVTTPLVVAQRKSSFFSGLSDLRWLKVGHIIGYAILGLTLWRAFWLSNKPGVLWPVLISMMYACTDEFHQNFVPGRSGSISDVLLDTVAALLAIELFLLLKVVWKNKAKKA